MTERELLLALVSHPEAGLWEDNYANDLCIYCDDFYYGGHHKPSYPHAEDCPLRLARELLGVKMKREEGE